MTTNRILTDIDRNNYSPLIESMFEKCPDMMSRKIPEANVQQAFTVDTVTKYGNKDQKILSVGCYEDTGFEFLKETGYNVTGIDPETDYDLDTYLKLNPESLETFDIVFSTSVIEHVVDDEKFILDMCKLLKRKGIGIITTDFKDDYKKGDPLPYSDVRFYTKHDLTTRLNSLINSQNCHLIDSPNWDDVDDFVYQGHQYSFATFVFVRN